MANYRVEKVRQAILRDVNEIVRKNVKDPRVKNLTFTDVSVTGDLQEATIYYTSLEKKASELERIEHGLEKAKGLIRSHLGKQLGIFKTPQITFEYDRSIEYGEHIDDLIRQLHKDEEF